jgi:hypothetical protein
MAHVRGHFFCWIPLLTIRFKNVLPQWLLSRTLRPWSLQSGQEIFVRQCSRSSKFGFPGGIASSSGSPSGVPPPFFLWQRGGSSWIAFCILPPFGGPRTRTLVVASLGCARPSVAAPPVAARRLRACLPVGSQPRALSHLASRVPTPWTWRRWLSQPRQWVQRRRYPWPSSAHNW